MKELNLDQLSVGWKLIKFHEVIEFLTDFQANGSFAGLRENVEYYNEKNYAVLVRLKDLRRQLTDENSFVYTDEKGYNFLKKSRVVQGNILVANVGAGVGTTLMMPKFLGKATLGPNMFRVDLNKAIIDKYFLAFSNSLNYWEQLRQVSAGSGQPKINKAQYKSIQIPLPPLKTQQAIVSKLEELFSELDKGIENLLTAHQQLKTYRQSVLKLAFEGKQTENWNNLLLNEVCDPRRGISYGVIKLGNYDDNGIHCLRTSDVKLLKIDKDQVKKISSEISNNYKRTILEGGEVLVNIRGTLGGVAIVPPQLKGWNISREIAVVPLLKQHNSNFIAFQIASIKSQNWLKGVTRGIAYSGINLNDLRNLPIVVPSLTEQNNIVEEIEVRLSLTDKMEETITQNLQQAAALRQSILKKAFEGKLITE